MNPGEVPTPEQIYADPAASFWLKQALRAALIRDPVDAHRDAELLTEVLWNRCAELLGGDQ